ncbi:MAG: hypothetical protein WAU70_14790 [Flavobacteriales bacterium]
MLQHTLLFSSFIFPLMITAQTRTEVTFGSQEFMAADQQEVPEGESWVLTEMSGHGKLTIATGFGATVILTAQSGSGAPHTVMLVLQGSSEPSASTYLYATLPFVLPAGTKVTFSTEAGDLIRVVQVRP